MDQQAKTKRTGRRYVVVVIAICAAILLLRLGCCHEPPDLTACTRVEIHYTGGALYYFFPGTAWQETILTEDERRYVRSFDKWTVTDQEQIKAFAELIRQGTYRGRAFGIIDDVPVNITCYKGSRRVAWFAVHARSITTRTECEFAYTTEVPILRGLDPPGLKPLQARWECATNLSALVFEGLWLGRRDKHCPDPNQWCDTIVEAYREHYVIHLDEDGRRERSHPDFHIARRFTCPGTHATNDSHTEPNETNPPLANWVSDYAMNSNCRDDSPDDMVFLFESKPGWNQHGGSELFTFDNHDPQGSCVLLRGGKVRFIRTEEELHALHWE